MSDHGDLVTVSILALPVAVSLRASEHGDELIREFAFIAAAGEHQADVPVRLTAVVEEMRRRFSGFTLSQDIEMAEAAARGDTTIDLEYRVPPAVAQAAADLAALLDDADEFCRAGDLLTLATPPEAVAFRRWLLGEFVRQIAGLPPIAWADWKP